MRFLKISMGRRGLAGLLAGMLILFPQVSYTDSAPLIRVFLYRPVVFADTYLGPNLPAPGTVRGTALWYVRMDDQDRARYGAKRIASFVRANGVPGLDFTGNKTFTTGDLEQLFGTLQWLQLDASAKFRLLKLRGTLTDDRAMATLSRLFDLQVLETSERVTDAGVAQLANLKQLKVLSLSNPAISDASVEILSQMGQLERLDIQNTSISNNGLKKLQKLRLRQLSVSSLITDSGLAALSEMTSLEQLDLQHAQVSGKGLATLSKLTRLHTLFLGPSFTDADVPTLMAFPNLQRLDLTGARLSDASLATLARIGTLQEISLAKTKVSDPLWKAFKGLPQLRYLDVSETAISAQGWKTIEGFESLQVLAVSPSGRLQARDLKPLARLLRLHTIIINGQPLGRDLVSFLRHWEEVRNWLMDQLVPNAYAEKISEKDVNQALEVASLPHDAEESRLRPGLPMIHQVESDLNEIIAAPNMINVDNQQDTEQNFLGEITINAGPSKRKVKKGISQ